MKIIKKKLIYKKGENFSPFYISNFVFVLVGIPLAITTHRREKFIGFGLAIMLFLIYWGIMLGGIACSIRGIVPAWAGVWSADILLFCLGVFLFHRIAKL